MDLRNVGHRNQVRSLGSDPRPKTRSWRPKHLCSGRGDPGSSRSESIRQTQEAISALLEADGEEARREENWAGRRVERPGAATRPGPLMNLRKRQAASLGGIGETVIAVGAS